jgi:hypothetical protein
VSGPKVIYDYDPKNLPRALLKAIGQAIAAGSQTEAIISMAIMGCLGIDAEYGYAVTTHMTLPHKYDVLKSVAEIRLTNPADLDSLDTLLANIEKALGKRHLVAHDGWCRNPHTNETFRSHIRARGSLQAELIPVTAQSVEKDALFIYDAGMELMEFVQQHGLIPSIPGLRPRGHKTKAARKKRRERG